MKLSELQPANVWTIFESITRVPRPSKHEEHIRAFLLDFAQHHNLAARQDDCGNVAISKPASPGCENIPAIVLQAHMDMVCEKNDNVTHDFTRDAIRTIIDGNIVRADGTTLGADDGIGIAAALAVVTDDTIQHGPIECLFTVDEETGLTGANNLGQNMITGRTLLNLDSEEEGQIYIGCAGGCSTIATFDIETEAVEGNVLGLRVTVGGLQGGHSGGDIHLGRGNANKIIARFAQQAMEDNGLRLSDIHGGNLHNAIAREAYLEGIVPFSERENIRVAFNIFVAEIQDELHATDSGLTMTMETVDTPRAVFTNDFQHRLVGALIACPHGVIEMNHEIDNLVETSTNLASIARRENSIVVCTSQRSSVESAKLYVQRMCRSLFELAGASVECGDGYPGWQPNVNSPILQISTDVYRRMFHREPQVMAIHAGLECGLFLEKYPQLDMISFGPTLRGVHSPDECIEIETVAQFWDFLVGIIEEFAKQK